LTSVTALRNGEVWSEIGIWLTSTSGAPNGQGSYHTTLPDGTGFWDFYLEKKPGYTIDFTVSTDNYSFTEQGDKYLFKLPPAHHVTVTYVQACYRLVKLSTPPSGGTINVNPAPNCGTDRYIHGTTVMLSATANAEHNFIEWGGSTSGTANSATILMDSDKSVTANFSAIAVENAVVVGDTTGSVNTPYTFDAAISPANTVKVQYQWSPEPQSGQGTSRASYVWSTPGSYTIELTVRDSSTDETGEPPVLSNPIYLPLVFAGSRSTTELTSSSVSRTNGSIRASHVIVIDGPSVAVSGVSIDGPTLGSINQSLSFVATVNPTNATQPVAYTWSPEPTSGQGTSQATYSWSSAGDYSIQVVASNGGGTATTSHAIRINPAFTATPTNTPQPTNTPIPTNTSTSVPTSTPTKTPLPTHTPTPVPTPTPTPFFFFDNFSSTSSGWPTINDSAYQARYRSNEYEITIYGNNVEAWQTNSQNVTIPSNITNYSVEAKMRLYSGSPIRYGFVFDLVNSTNFYIYTVNPDSQSWRLERVLNGTRTTVSDGTNGIINTGGTTNLLKVKVQNGRIYMYVNGIQVDSQPGGAFTGSRRAGLTAKAGTGTATARYDDFTYQWE